MSDHLQGRPYGNGAGRRAPGGVFGTLHVVGGNDRGKQHSLQSPETTVGRGADQEVILADIAVSRRHFIIAIDGERYRLRDLGSGNGTLINGVRLDGVILNDGDQIEIGNTVLRLEHAPSSKHAALATPAPHQQPSLAVGMENKTMMAGEALNPSLLPPPPAPAYAPPPAYMQQPPPQQYQQQQQQQQQGFNQTLGGNNQQPVALPPPPMMMPQDGIAMPPSQRPVSSALPPPVDTGARSSPARSGGMMKILIAVGGVFVILAVAGVIILKKVVFVSGDVSKTYAEAQKAFTDGDYAGAKTLFQTALKTDPKFEPALVGSKQCDVEINARTALKAANALAAKKKWAEVLKQLDSIDKTAESYKQSESLRKEAVPGAIEIYLDEAKELQKSDAEAALAKVEEALNLDPENDDALALEKQLKAKGAGKERVARSDKSEKSSSKSEKSASSKSEKSEKASSKSEKTEKSEKSEKASSKTEKSEKSDKKDEKFAAVNDPKDKKSTKSTKDDDELAPVKSKDSKSTTTTASNTTTSKDTKDTKDTKDSKDAKAGGGAAIDLLTSKAGAPYKARDFPNAAQALLLEAKNVTGKAADNAIATAAQIKQLGNAYTKAEAAVKSNAATAITEYQNAMGIDAKIAKGFHGAYFKGQLGKMSKQSALEAFKAGKFDVAFDAAKSCAKYGSDDGGVGKQLSSKAAELNTKAAGLGKAKAADAKALWRQVLKMVPSSDPAFTKATASLKAAESHADEDE